MINCYNPTYPPEDQSPGIKKYPIFSTWPSTIPTLFTRSPHKDLSPTYIIRKRLPHPSAIKKTLYMNKFALMQWADSTKDNSLISFPLPKQTAILKKMLCMLQKYNLMWHLILLSPVSLLAWPLYRRVFTYLPYITIIREVWWRYFSNVLYLPFSYHISASCLD